MAGTPMRLVRHLKAGKAPVTERNDILELRLQLTAMLGHSPANAACKAIASLMAAAIACRQGEMPSEVAAAMLVDYYRRDPLE